jgi:hypothetical protein
MNEPDLIERLATALAEHVKPNIPVDIALWDLATVAAYFNRSTQMVRTTIACLPSFPKAIRLPSAGKAQPLYKATEVMDWAQRFRDKH